MQDNPNIPPEIMNNSKNSQLDIFKIWEECARKTPYKYGFIRPSRHLVQFVATILPSKDETRESLRRAFQEFSEIGDKHHLAKLHCFLKSVQLKKS